MYYKTPSPKLRGRMNGDQEGCRLWTGSWWDVSITSENWNALHDIAWHEKLLWCLRHNDFNRSSSLLWCHRHNDFNRNSCDVLDTMTSIEARTSVRSLTLIGTMEKKHHTCSSCAQHRDATPLARSNQRHLQVPQQAWYSPETWCACCAQRPMLPPGFHATTDNLQIKSFREKLMRGTPGWVMNKGARPWNATETQLRINACFAVKRANALLFSMQRHLNSKSRHNMCLCARVHDNLQDRKELKNCASRGNHSP